MCKPYSIFKRHTGIYYVQFRMSDGSRSTSKSTGCRTRIEAERKAMEWVVNGQIPSRIIWNKFVKKYQLYSFLVTNINNLLCLN